jgi:hypothetical protein
VQQRRRAQRDVAAFVRQLAPGRAVELGVQGGEQLLAGAGLAGLGRGKQGGQRGVGHGRARAPGAHARIIRHGGLRGSSCTTR